MWFHCYGQIFCYTEHVKIKAICQGHDAIFATYLGPEVLNWVGEFPFRWAMLAKDPKASHKKRQMGYLVRSLERR